MTEKTRIKRLPERAVTDMDAVHAILDAGFHCHAAYVTEGRPVVLPILYARLGDRILLHGSTSMGLARAVRAGSPLSVAVTHLDGLVVARSAFNSSANYRSVVIHGTGTLLEGEEKRRALDHIVDTLLPGRLADVRPSTEPELRQTTVISLPLDEVSAKVRTGDPEDEPEDMAAHVWAGVVPMRQETGDPVPSADLVPGIDVPDYLRRLTR
ncbi:MAG TPA: pyridoxamine 5'-phosphate oxidase family protein [Acidimicrobiia bacterium]|jgi:nitroimidazol reductase NimA-like FMN-containing flavoprotein (pyridoxamine 5'-phosphate oxidase superfamily)|nr:pyridoxamine 5'-phosphate oxidase family protein [Acidimicrobiia bacterium]